MNKNNIILFVLFLFPVSFTAFAQENSYEASTAINNDTFEVVVDSMNVVDDLNENYNFHFVYIDHESSTPVSKICRYLIKIYNDAQETGDKLVIYLANEEKPFISFMNIADPSIDLHRDSLRYFEEIIDELQNVNYHDVYADVDLNIIKQLLGIDGSIPLFKEVDYEERLSFKSVTMDFYIGKRFWALNYNEAIIANLFVSLQIPKFMKKYPVTSLAFNVFKPEGEQLEYPERMPFGQNNLENINEVINIKAY